MQTTLLSFTNLHHHGELFTNLLRARRQSFIIQNRWDLPEEDGMEFDQYDTPQSRWVVIHERGEILAGVRLTPSTARCGMYSYMIRDAQRGLLDGSIPADLLYDEAPVAPHVWEATRGFVNHQVPTAMRKKVQHALIAEMTNSARIVGATQMIAIVTRLWPVWSKRLGLDIQAIGRPLEFEDGVSQAISISLATKLH